MPYKTYRGIDGKLHEEYVLPEWELIAEGNRRMEERNNEKADELEDSLAIPKNSKAGFESMAQVRTEFDKLERGIGEKLRRRLVREVPRAAKRAVLLGLGGLIFWAGLNASNCISEKSLETSKIRDDNPIGYLSTLNSREHREFGIDDYPLTQRREVLNILAPYMDDAEARLPQIEESDEWLGLGYTFSYSGPIQGLSDRFVSAWQRSNFLNLEEATKGYAQEGEERTKIGFAPTTFKRQFFDHHEVDSHRTLSHGTAYLRDCISPGNDLADTYATFYSTEKEIREAMITTESTRYFPTFGENGEILEPGYGSALKQHEQNLINSALAIHYLTDVDGRDVHFERLPSLRKKAREGRR